MTAAYQRQAQGSAGWEPFELPDAPSEGDFEGYTPNNKEGRQIGGPEASTVFNAGVGRAIAEEGFWDQNAQPMRRRVMEQFNKLPASTRSKIFDDAMEQGLTLEGITDPAEREYWKRAMSIVALGEPGVPGENAELNPYMLAGESGGVWLTQEQRDRINSVAIGYFQLLAKNGRGDSSDEWRVFAPADVPYEQITDPVSQVRWFINAVR